MAFAVQTTGLSASSATADKTEKAMIYCRIEELQRRYVAYSTARIGVPASESLAAGHGPIVSHRISDPNDTWGTTGVSLAGQKTI
jgi:hypothetical protein